MTIQNWISRQNETVQMAVWKHISHFLSNMELNYIMNGVRQGKDLMKLHEELGVFEKYQVDMLRMMDIIKRRYPDDVIYF